MSERTRTQKSLSAGKRIFLVILVMAGVMITVLKLAESSKDPLRLGLQDYLVKATGHPSEITSLQRSKLFPDIDFVAEGIVVRDGANRERTLVTVENAAIAMPFWKRFLGVADYRALSFRNVAIATGYVLPKKIELTFAGISASADLSVPAFFVIDGRYNNRDILMTAEMRRHGESRPTFDFAKSFPVTFKIGNSEAMGTLERKGGKTGFEELEVRTGKHKAILHFPDIKINPLSATFKGEMENIVFDGSINRDSGKTVVTINMIEGDAGPVKELISSLKEDLGLEDDSFVKITLNSAADKPAETSQEEKSE